jgi:hypothetical protein
MAHCLHPVNGLSHFNIMKSMGYLYCAKNGQTAEGQGFRHVAGHLPLLPTNLSPDSVDDFRLACRMFVQPSAA